MHKLVLLRHGESAWNLENRFTGWVDVDLSEGGTAEARRSAQALKSGGYTFDVAFTSVLKRAIRTLWIVLDGMDLMWVPVHRSWRLNERHYGSLTGLDKAETAAQYGEEQVLVWRRSFDVPPPPLERSDDRYQGQDPRYAELGPGGRAGHREPGGHRSPSAALLAADHRAGHHGGAAGPHRCPRQQPARPGQVPRRPGRRRGRRSEPAHGRTPGL